MRCPVCRKPVEETSPASEAGPKSPFPFCSERCRLIDLGRWLSDKYQIPSGPEDEDPPPGAQDKHAEEHEAGAD